MKRGKKETREELAVITPVQGLRLLTSPQFSKKERLRALEALRGVNARKVLLFSCGAAAVFSAASLAGRYTFYRGVVAGELKRQLAGVNRKLDLLNEQNEQLRAELEKARQEE